MKAVILIIIMSAIQLLPKQAEFIQSQSTGTIFSAGIGSGKTYILSIKAILNALRKRKTAIVSFSYPMLRDVVHPTMLNVLPKMNLQQGLHWSFNGSSNAFTILGTKILLRSGDNPDTLRGLNLHDFFLDEARQFKDRKIFDVLLGRIREGLNNQWFICTSPKGRNWVWELKEKDPTIKWIVQTTQENWFLSNQYIAELRKQYSTRFASQELDAEIIDFGGDIINSAWFLLCPTFTVNTGVRFWDLAVSIKTSADYSCGSLCTTHMNKFTIADQIHGHFQYPDLRKKIIETAKKDGKNIIIGIEAYGQQGGFVDDLQREPELRGYSIKKSTIPGDKLSRALPWISRAESGNVLLVQAGWNQDFFDECNSFTANDSHQHDDRIDSVSGAYHLLYSHSIPQSGRIAF